MRVSTLLIAAVVAILSAAEANANCDALTQVDNAAKLVTKASDLVCDAFLIKNFIEPLCDAYANLVKSVTALKKVSCASSQAQSLVSSIGG